MNGTQNINIDAKTLEQCLKGTSKFGETIYKNICTGETYSVPAGQWDWIVAIVLTLIGISFCLMLLKIVFD